jgi:hypothetical protein
MVWKGGVEDAQACTFTLDAINASRRLDVEWGFS